ncbi:MAG: hypothetical protein J6R29_05015 [Clostridia bacterium]|nr:hypothetical protein [Clostridia bacterium]
MKKALSIICLIALLTSFILLPFFTSELTASGQKKEYKAILRIWHIDTFEGGAGSRATFLKNVGAKFTKKNKGVLFLVSSLTENSAIKKIENGELPDLISFGAGSLNVYENLYSQSKLNVKDGGTFNDKRYLTAWCMGGYFKITKGKKDYSKLIISQGNSNLSTVAVCLEKLNANSVVIKQPLEAYSLFLNSQDACLIGTQRDIVRLISKGVSFEATPIPSFNDLYQYVGVTSKDETKRLYAFSFIDFLLSRDIQKTLVNIKMLSPLYKGLYLDNAYYTALENTNFTYTISPFLSKSDISAINETAKSQILNQNYDANALKFLKQL